MLSRTGVLKVLNRWWVSLPVFASLSYLYFVRRKRDVNHVKPWKPWQQTFYCSLPLHGVSRFWGRLNEYNIPTFLRRPILGTFAWLIGCDLSEAVEPNLLSYRNASELFRRSIREDLRPIADAKLVAPADGLIVQCGEVQQNRIEQVKGISYDLHSFLGEKLPHQSIGDALVPQLSEGNRLYSCVVYLSPADYHGFHSPADWLIQCRRHFTGHLLSVGITAVHRVKNLFCLNERILLVGRWSYGFFSFTAVGATNVGNIKILWEEKLKTNRCKSVPFLQYENVYEPLIVAEKGKKIGEFNFGSSIVLIFEAPDDFRFTVCRGQRVKYGQSLGGCRPVVRKPLPSAAAQCTNVD